MRDWHNPQVGIDKPLDLTARSLTVKAEPVQVSTPVQVTIPTDALRVDVDVKPCVVEVIAPPHTVNVPAPVVNVEQASNTVNVTVKLPWWWVPAIVAGPIVTALLLR